MNDEFNDQNLDERLRAADPLRHDLPPSEADTEAALRRTLASDPAAPRSRRFRRFPGPRTWFSDLGLRVAVIRGGAAATEPGKPPAPKRRRGLLAATTLAIVALATGMSLLLSATANPEPAFAVTRNSDGTVTVRVFRVWEMVPVQVAALNHTLAKMGARAKFVKGVQVLAPRAALVSCGPAQEMTLSVAAMQRPIQIWFDRSGRLSVPAAAARALAMVHAAAPWTVARPGTTHIHIYAGTGTQTSGGTGTQTTGGTGTQTTGGTGTQTAGGTGTQTSGATGSQTTFSAPPNGGGPGAPPPAAIRARLIARAKAFKLIHCGAPPGAPAGTATVFGPGTPPTGSTGTQTTGSAGSQTSGGTGTQTSGH